MLYVKRDNQNMAQKYGEKLKKALRCFFSSSTFVNSLQYHRQKSSNCEKTFLFSLRRRFIYAAELHNIKYIENKSASVQD